MPKGAAFKRSRLMSDRVKLAREIAARTEPRFIKKDAAMRLMCIFCLLFVGVVGAANAQQLKQTQRRR